MEIFELLAGHDHEQLIFCHEPSSGYRGLIAIHNTPLGPALGGTRYWHYTSEHDAVIDALRLSRGMTYKAAVAGLNMGGGKSVILGDPHAARRELIFRAHGRAVDSLKGRYITAEDVGTTVEDMDFVHMETRHVVGIGSGSGDPSPVTAFGVFRGMQASAKQKWGSDSLSGVTVAVQGLGHVGFHLCRHLVAEGARLIVTDIEAARVQKAVNELGAESVSSERIYSADAQIFAPCALGAVVNDQTIPQFKFEIIAGAANNQLAEDRHGDELQKRGILYAPDYVINAGGLINVYGELEHWTADRAMRKAGEIYHALLQLFEIAQDQGVPTHVAADKLAERRIEAVGQIQRTWL